jgi:hypothetical protein
MTMKILVSSEPQGMKGEVKNDRKNN